MERIDRGRGVSRLASRGGHRCGARVERPRRGSRILFGLVGILLASALAAPVRATDQGGLEPRRPPEKPSLTRVDPLRGPAAIVVKFSEGSGLRMGRGRGLGISAASTALEGSLASFGMTSADLVPLFTRAQADLDRERERGEAWSGRKLADLTLYHTLRAAPGRVGALCDALNRLDFVELATPAPLPVRPPGDLAPHTPKFDSIQWEDYFALPPVGMGLPRPSALRASKGRGVRMVDIEYSWTLDHEDLELPPSAVIDTATPSDPFGPDHGTAVLGILAGQINGYGIRGIVPAAAMRVAPANTVEFGYSVARAVSLATGALRAGDVILVEQQFCVCEPDPCEAYGPVEWQQAEFDAISTATANGITVVEAAGNGGVNLDGPACLGRFDRGVRDSRAIIVGAGAASSPEHPRLPFSSFGARVDLKGWGQRVFTAGYGDAFDPDDPRQRYTAFFSGTSSASPMVAGAAALLQGVRRARDLPPLLPADLRELLVATGTPGPPVGDIGPLPNLPAALSQLDCGGSCGSWGRLGRSFAGSEDPTLVAYKGELWAFARAANGAIVSQRVGQAAWEDLPGPSIESTSGPTATVYEGELYLFVRGPGDQAYMRRLTDEWSWTAWEAVAPGILLAAAPTPQAYDGAICLYAQEASSRVFFTCSDETVESWRAWSQVPGKRRASGAPASVIAPGRSLLYVRGTNGRIYETFYDYAVPGWTGTWTRVPGALLTSSAPTAVALPQGLRLYARGLDDRIHEKANPAGAWGAWQEVAGSMRSVSRVAAAAVGDWVYLLARGEDAGLYRQQRATGG